MQPAVARVSFDGIGEDGVRFGVYLEVQPEKLRNASWGVELRGNEATQLGVGVLIYGTDNSRISVKRGSLRASLAGSELIGSFETDDPSIASGSFRGRYVIDCYTRTDPASGRLSDGATMWERDLSFSSSLCAPFKPAE
jgi:hypothetical protein